MLLKFLHIYCYLEFCQNGLFIFKINPPSPHSPKMHLFSSVFELRTKCLSFFLLFFHYFLFFVINYFLLFCFISFTLLFLLFDIFYIYMYFLPYLFLTYSKFIFTLNIFYFLFLHYIFPPYLVILLSFPLPFFYF